MPDLKTSLREQDLGYLQIVANRWGISLRKADLETARKDLVSQILDAALVEEMVIALPEDSSTALADLMQHAGRLPWVRFTQQHGAFRKMGSARREREKPHDNEPSAVETLFYSGLIAVAFLDTPDGPQEFAYIPDDLLPLLPFVPAGPEKPVGRPAREKEHAHTFPAGDGILDDATTLLAALRSGRTQGQFLPPEREAFLHALLSEAGLIAADQTPEVEQVREFLEAPRNEALAMLARTWVESPSLNDLLLVPSLAAEGEWRNDPLPARRRILNFLAQLPPGVWWSLPAFVAGVKENQPEFLRPDGDFDSWFLKDRQTGSYLRGIAHWDEIEGALVRWLIAGPLHWLGIIDLADETEPLSNGTAAWGPAAAFRLSNWAENLLHGRPPPGVRQDDQKIHVRSDGRILAPRHAPRAARYLIARFCEWEEPGFDEYRYRPTPASLSHAADFGLNVSQLIALLARHTNGIPSNVTKALKDWQKKGVAARIERDPVLRLPSPEALTALRASRGARFLGDVLGPAAVAIKPGTEQRVLAVLVELGYLGEIREET